MRKSGKNPTRKQKEYIVRAGLNLGNWLVQREDDRYLYLVHRYTSTVRKALKRERGDCSGKG